MELLWLGRSKFYGCPSFFNRAVRDFSGFQFLSGELRRPRLANAVALPVLGWPDDGIFRGGVALDGALIPESTYLPPPWRKERAAHTVRQDWSIRVGKDVIEGKSIWLGHAFNHFGHCLLESTSRLWALTEDYDNYLFAADRDPSELFFDVMTLLGVPRDRIKFVRGPQAVLDITVPEPAAVHGRSIHLDFLKPFLRARPPRKRRKLHVYLSRTQLPGASASEAEIEHHLSRAGIDIVYPETLSVRDQADLFSRCTALAGIEGSALHNILHTPDSALHVLCRRPLRPPILALDGIRGGVGHYFDARQGADLNVPGCISFLEQSGFVSRRRTARSFLAQVFSSAPTP